MMIHIADCHPDSRLLPPAGHPDRAKAYRWLFFGTVNIYESGCRISDPQHYSDHEPDFDGLRARARLDLDRYWDMVEEVLVEPPFHARSRVLRRRHLLAHDGAMAPRHGRPLSSASRREGTLRRDPESTCDRGNLGPQLPRVTGKKAADRGPSSSIDDLNATRKMREADAVVVTHVDGLTQLHPPTLHPHSQDDVHHCVGGHFDLLARPKAEGMLGPSLARSPRQSSSRCGFSSRDRSDRERVASSRARRCTQRRPEAWPGLLRAPH